MSGYVPLNMAQLPAPAALEALNFEAILDANMQVYVAYWNAARALDPTLPLYNVGALESDPVKMLLEVNAYCQIMLRGRINDAVKAGSLAYAVGADLDVIAANFNTVRATGETDDSLRRRAQLSFENLSIGGSYGGYKYRALTAAPVELSDVAVYGHEVAGVAPGEVRIVCLGSNLGSIVAPATLKRVRDALSPRDTRKVNDFVNVVAANAVNYNVDATVILRRGADPASVVAAQKVQLAAHVLSRRAISAYVSQSSIAAVLGHDDPGYIVDVRMNSPVGRIGGGPFDAPVCVGVHLAWEYAA